MFERPARPADKFVNPYANNNEARANNNGAYPPDLSVITKSRKYGVDYIYNLLLGYLEPTQEVWNRIESKTDDLQKRHSIDEIKPI